MKKFIVLTHNIKNHRCLVITSFKANTTKEARIFAAQNYMKYTTPDEQLVCCNEAQYNSLWRDLVEVTDRLHNEVDF